MQLPALVKPNVASTELQFAARDLEADESLGSFSEELEQKFCCEFYSYSTEVTSIQLPCLLTQEGGQPRHNLRTHEWADTQR
jgi:uncharacterized protein YceH (UPF0502 family)